MGNLPTVPLHLPGGAPTTGTASAAFTPSDGFFLIEAARSGNTEVLQLFLNKNKALAWAHSGRDSVTPWHCAAEEGHADALRVLADVATQAALSNNHNPIRKAVNQADALGRTPLMLACHGGHHECVKQLLDLGADWSAMDIKGQTPLHHAALSAQGGQCVELLLRAAGLWDEEGPAPPKDKTLLTYVDSGDVHYGRTALHLAAWVGQSQGVEALLAAGASMYATTTADCFESSFPCNQGTTPMHLAAMRGHQHVVVLLMDAYVRKARRHPSVRDPRTILDKYDNTPFKMASDRRHDSRILLQVLNPDTPILELQRAEQRRKQRETAAAAAPAAPATDEAAARKPRPSVEGRVHSMVLQLEAGTGHAGHGSGGGHASHVDRRKSQESPNNVSGQPPRSPQHSTGGGQPHSSAEPADGPHGTVASPNTKAAMSEAQVASDEGAGHSSPDVKAAGVHQPSASPRSSAVSPSANGPPLSPTSPTPLSPGPHTDNTAASTDSSDYTDTDSDEGGTSEVASPTGRGPGMRGGMQRDAGVAVRAGEAVSIRRLRRLVTLYDEAQRALAEQAKPHVAPMQARMEASNGVSTAGDHPPAAPAQPPAPQPPQPPAQQHSQLSSDPIPDFCSCPISGRLFKDPVVAQDGYTYEREAIERHLEACKKRGAQFISPQTHRLLEGDMLVPNLTLKTVVAWWVDQHKEHAGELA